MYMYRVCYMYRCTSYTTFFQAGDDLRQQQREGEELQRQMEEDTDQEILALKNRYERQLREQHDENLKLRGDTGILRKKVMNR